MIPEASTDITMSTWPSDVTSCSRYISEVERGDHADLLEEVEEVELVPVLHELAVLDPPDVDGPHLDRVPRRGHTVEGAIVGASVGESSNHAISGHHQIVHRRFD